MDGVHDERGLHADEAADAGVAALELLVEEAGFDVVHAGAAVAVEGGAEEAELAHRADEFFGEAAVAIAVLDDGDEFVFDEGAGVGADEELVFGEEGVELEEVYALKLECHSLAILDERERWRAWAISRRGVARGRRYGSGLQPLGLLWAVTWGFAPGCDVGGPLALGAPLAPTGALLALRRSCFGSPCGVS